MIEISYYRYWFTWSTFSCTAYELDEEEEIGQQLYAQMMGWA